MNIRKDILKINLTIAKFTKEQIETIIQCIQHAEQNYVDYMEKMVNIKKFQEYHNKIDKFLLDEFVWQTQRFYLLKLFKQQHDFYLEDLEELYND